MSKQVRKITNNVSKYDSSSERTNYIAGYINNISNMSKSTAQEYFGRLSIFEKFVLSQYDITVNDLTLKINEGREDPYSVLNSFCAYLQNNCDNISSSTIKQRVVTVKNFLEYYDVDISPRKFKLKVKLSKVVRKNKEALSKEDITEILNACSDIRLKTYCMFLAATGCRAVEAISIRVCDLDLDSNPANVFIRGEYTKTKVDRRVYLAQEIVSQLKSWLDYKYRKRRISSEDIQTNKSITEYRTPRRNPNDLIFSVYQAYRNPKPSNIYYDLCFQFERTLDRMGKGEFEDNNRRRRKITFHSFQRWVLSTISDLGYSDYAVWFIGHAGSTYYRKPSKEREEIFRKIESSLTYLDFPSLERKGADVQSKIDTLEKENQALRQNNTMVLDSVQSLSDRVSQLMQEIEILKKR
jgi:integrase